MDEQRVRLTAVAGAIGAGSLALAALLLLAQRPERVLADPGDAFVVPGGSGDCSQASPCSLATAMISATSGDVVFLAQGTYTGTGEAVISITQGIRLVGGWDGTTAMPVVVDPVSYPSTLDGERARRVVYIAAGISPGLDGLIITRGSAGAASVAPGYGGGICSNGSDPVIINCTIVDNVGGSGSAIGGGGISLQDSSNARLSLNTIVSNTASSGGFGRGGGLQVIYGTAVVTGNVFMSNTASTAGSGYGGGVYLYESEVTFGDNQVLTNVGSTAGYGMGGGVWIEYGDVTVAHNLIRGNAARAGEPSTGGGLLALRITALTLESNLIISNTADSGGGIAVLQDSVFTMANNIVADNAACSRGAGLYMGGADGEMTEGRLYHNTFAAATTSSGEAIYVDPYVTLGLTNTIVASHTVGITNTSPVSSTVWAAYTLFAGNGGDYGAGVSSSHAVPGTPRFVSPSTGDYHIELLSAAVDAGVAAGVVSDIDGQVRVDLPDLGADEFAKWKVFLPLVLRSY